jgi:hypothetical protein
MSIVSLQVSLEQPPGAGVELQADGNGDTPPTYAAPSRPLYFYSQHTELPLCAMPEFIRAAYNFSDHAEQSTGLTAGTPQQPLVCYAEDGRSMCTVAYSVCPCSTLPAGPPSLKGLRYDALHCYVPDAELGARTDCVRLLAESNGYTMTPQ